jgi:anti-sigma B factor antagonist
MASFPLGTEQLTVTLQHLDGYAEVVLIGDLDVATVPDLRAVLNGLIAEGHIDLRLNVSGLAFMDATGVGALVEVRARLASLGGQLSLMFVHGLPERILGICGLLDVFTQSRSTTVTPRPPGTQP